MENVYEAMRAVFFILIAFLIAGCTRTLYVPQEVEKIKYKDRILVDSVYYRDSVFFMLKGDTVYLEKYKYIYRDKLIRDSVYLRDSVSYPVYVDVVKEVKRVPKFYKFCFAFTMISVGFGAFRILRKRFGIL